MTTEIDPLHPELAIKNLPANTNKKVEAFMELEEEISSWNVCFKKQVKKRGLKLQLV